MKRLLGLLALVVLSSAAASPGREPYSNTTPGAQLALEIPGMHRASVRRNLVYRRVGGERLQMDVYRPRGAGSRRLPAVVLGGPYALGAGRDSGQKVGWAQAIAASGLAAVAFDFRSDNYLRTPRPPSTDVAAAIAYVRSNAGRLGIDANRLCTLGFSLGTAPWHLWAAMRGPNPSVRCNAVFYGPLDFTAGGFDLGGRLAVEFSALTYLERDGAAIAPMLIAKAGQDDPAINGAIDRFVAAARRVQAPVKLFTYPSGVHAFDVRQHDARSKAIIRRTLAFFRERLLARRATAAARERRAAADVSQRLDSILTEATRNREFNGSVLIARNDRVLLRKGYGYADVSRREPTRPSTRYRISSLTATFNAVALLQLVERGTLRLDQSVCAFVPRCPRAWRPMTVNMLLAGNSGLASVEPYPRTTRSLDAWIEWLRGQPLVFQPGKGRDRSEARSLLVAYLLERVAGRPWLDQLERSIFRPLGMTSTGVDRSGAPRRATPYFRTRRRTLGPAASFSALSDPDAVYGLMSTVDDMYRFDQALHSGRLVRMETLQAARAPGGRDWTSHLELGHGPHGTADGWYTAYTHRDDQDVTILAFSNMGGYSLGDLEHRLFFTAIEWPPAAVEVDAAALTRFAGSYTWRDPYYKRTVTIRITEAAGRLRFWWDRWPPGRFPRTGIRIRPWEGLLTPTSETSFFATFDVDGFEMLGWTFTFELDPDGRPRSVRVSNEGLEGRAVRYQRLE